MQVFAELQGTVRDIQGQPLPGVKINPVNVENTSTYYGVSDTEGQYRFRALSPGEYLVTAELEGFNPSEYAIHLTQGQDAELDITMQPTLSE